MWWILIVVTLVGLIILLTVLRSQRDRVWFAEIQKIKAQQQTAQQTSSAATRRTHSSVSRASIPTVQAVPIVADTPAPVQAINVVEARSLASNGVKPLNKPAADLPVIDFDDPALVRTRERARAKVEKLSAEIPRVAKPKAPEPVPQEPQIIEEEDIRANLLRQRLTRRRAPNGRADMLRHPRVMHEEEVFANLAKTDSPVNRRLRRVSTAVRESVLPEAATLSAAHTSTIVRPKPMVAAGLNRPMTALSNRFAPYPPAPKPNKASAAPVANVAAQPAAVDLNSRLTTPVPVQAAAIQPPEPKNSVHIVASAASWSITDHALADTPAPEPQTPPPPQPQEITPDYIFGEVPDTLWQETAPSEANISPPEPVATEISSPPTAEPQQAVEPPPTLEPTPDYVLTDDSSENPDSEPPTYEPAYTQIQDLAFSPPVFELIEASDEQEIEETQPTVIVEQTVAAPVVDSSPTIIPPDWVLPNLDLLEPASFNPDATPSEETLLENSITIEEKLAEFRVRVKVIDAYAGPVITRYEIEPDVGVRGSSVLNLEKDLARSLGVSAIRVVETIPGKTCMGLELPNPKRQMIRLSEIFAAAEFQNSTSKLTLGLGQDITGKPVVTDLADAPHILVAGTTGSGKSVGVNTMILSILFRATPDEVRLIMIDPKMLELSIYEGIPHLLTPVVTDMKLAANALNWCVNEMERRYRLMSRLGMRNLVSYNDTIREAAEQGRKIPNPFSLTPDNPEPLEKLPLIVVVVDEFADLMMTAGKKIEELIARIAQKARAAGIHLILATQRPSVDVMTGLIKTNIPMRIAFQVSSKIDSHTIFSQKGAENLLGKGDMLIRTSGADYLQRVHGAFASDAEVHRVVEYLKQFGEPNYVEDILAASVGGDDSMGGSDSRNHDGDQRDSLYDEAVACVIKTQKATTSSVQRYLRIGYNRAANLIEQMEADGIISPADNGKRTVLVRDSGHLDT